MSTVTIAVDLEADRCAGIHRVAARARTSSARRAAPGSFPVDSQPDRDQENDVSRQDSARRYRILGRAVTLTLNGEEPIYAVIRLPKHTSKNANGCQGRTRRRPQAGDLSMRARKASTSFLELST
jgi:hypothetical protein